MSDWWDTARWSAAREFGARHYRWFAFMHVVRRLAPVGAVLLLGAGAGAVRLWWPQWFTASLIGLGVVAAAAVISRVVVRIWMYRGW